jgi:hypothetical protein
MCMFSMSMCFQVVNQLVIVLIVSLVSVFSENTVEIDWPIWCLNKCGTNVINRVLYLLGY